ncbi:MAG: TonB-dependent receptor [Melioribacteraceae bacterium]|nr:TonB-dependent receptor [Melioribacteraceae bacterium]
MNRKIILSCIISFFLPILIFGGTTGKISGFVTDYQSGEPLIGINILVEGTTIGAATDVNGEYIIMNLKPGKYNLISSGIGYKKRRIEQVQVNIDFTTNVDFQMASEAVEMDVIVVQAKQKLVRKDLTSSQANVTSEEIKSLPVESISGILTLQAGIVQGSDGALHIRGGRSNEIAYTVNGVSIGNPFSNSKMVSIATNAVQELSVVSGTFNAEYGNALSGVVNTVTKEGGSDYSGFISAYTGDKLSTRDDIFRDIDKFDILNDYVGEMTYGGPVPYLKDKLTFFVSGRYSKEKGWRNGRREQLPSDSVWINPKNSKDIKISSNGDDKIIPMNPYEGLNTTFKLTFKPISTLKINYDLIYSDSESKSYSHTYQYNPDALGTSYSTGLLNAIDVSHALSNRTFYTLKFSHNYNNYKSYLYPLLDASGNEVDYHAGMSTDDYHADPRYQPAHKDNRPASYTFSSGGTSNGHYYQRAQTIGAKFDLTSQINNNHEVKFGAQFKTHTMDYENFSILRDSLTYLTPTILSIYTPNHDKYTKEPVEFSAYIQDKMEFQSIVLNVGLRYDYFDSKSKYAPDIFKPSSNLIDADAKYVLSPRLGVSFPITDKGMIHFSYGHFYQMPPFSYLYSNPDFKYNYATGEQTFGNANLEPQKTVTYELGLQQELNENLAFNLTGFYRDVRDLLASQRIRISGDETYIKYVNKDYSNTKGITFSLTKRRGAGEMLSASIDYTFQVVEGNETDADAFFLDLSSGRQAEKVPVALGWDQAHTINTRISLSDPGDWNLSIVGKFGSGLPYTPLVTGKEVFVRTNSGRKPSKFTVDLLAEKSIELLGTDVTFFVKVYNLFDTLNETLVYSNTGRATYSLDALKGDAQYTDKLAETVDGIHPISEYFNNQSYYSPPRDIKIGMSLDF